MSSYLNGQRAENIASNGKYYADIRVKQIVDNMLLSPTNKSDAFLVEGATLACDKGTAPSELKLPKNHNIKLSGKYQINDADWVTGQNILSFKKCKITGLPCVPDPIGPWKATNKNQLVGGRPSVLVISCCPCAKGGLIEPQTSGQGLSGAAKQAFIKMLEEEYGFNEKQAKLLARTYNSFMARPETKAMGREEQLHEYFSNLSALCLDYSGSDLKWSLVAGTPKSLDAIKFFTDTLKMTSEETIDLMVSINKQHGGAGDDAYTNAGFCMEGSCNHNCEIQYHPKESEYWSKKNTDYKSMASPNKYQKDFAHEIIQYAVFSNPSLSKDLVDFATFDNIDFLSSFKGDVYSGALDDIDKISDIDAINTYKYFLKNTGNNIFTDIAIYHDRVDSGEINRAEEFYKNFGGGDVEKGKEKLKKSLDKETFGTLFLKIGAGGLMDIFCNITFNAYNANNMEKYDEELIKQAKILSDATDKAINTKNEFWDFLNKN